MHQRTLLGSLLAAIAMFVWGFLFWGLPIVQPIDSGLDGEKAQAALSGLLSRDGVYVFPEPPGQEMTEAWSALHRRGPLGMIFYRAAGAEPMAPTVFLLGFAHNLITCLLIALLLGKASSALAAYGSRVGFVALAGLAATIWGHAGDPIWLYHPWRFHLLAMAYDLVAWLLVGAILARFVRDPAAELRHPRG